jgi:hypothetical protein
LLHNPSRDRNIIEKAETHGAIRLRMMTRRTDDRERFLQITTSNSK